MSNRIVAWAVGLLVVFTVSYVAFTLALKALAS